MSELEKKNALREALLAGSQSAILGLLPVIGPAADAAFPGAANARWTNRVIATLEAIETRISNLEGANTEFLRSDEFSDLFTETMQSAAQLHDDAQRQLYASTVVAAAVNGPGSQVPARRVIARLERLTPPHFRLLKALAAPDENSHTRHYSSIQSFLDGTFQARVGSYPHRNAYQSVPSVHFDDLRAEGLIYSPHRPLDIQDRQTMQSHFDAQQVRDWLTWQAHECLQYLWPEEFA